MQVVPEIRAELGRQKLSYAELADSLKTTRQKIWRILTDDNRPLKDQEIKAIADVLGVPASELVRRAEEAEERKAGK